MHVFKFPKVFYGVPLLPPIKRREIIKIATGISKNMQILKNLILRDDNPILTCHIRQYPPVLLRSKWPHSCSIRIFQANPHAC